MTEFEAEITGCAHGGHGVCRTEEGRVAFVSHALPGDRVRVRVTRETRGVLWGQIARVIAPSPHRIKPECRHARTCGGCAWLHFAYPAQGEWKRQIVKDSLCRLANIDLDVDWLENPAFRTGYRTRAEFHAENGLLGFYKAGTHTVVDVVECPLCHPRLNETLTHLRGIRLQDSVEITVNPEGEEVFLWAKRPSAMLRRAFPIVGSPADKEEPASFLFDGVPIVNGAFSQSSLILNRQLTALVKEWAGKPDSVLDLYCGNGNFSLQLAAPHTLGLDHNRAAVRAANRLEQGEYRPGNEEAFKAAIQDRPWDLIIIDPPRTGAKDIADTLVNADAEKLIVVSCDPATLARDLKTFTTGGWQLETVAAVDMFPHTWHVETVCHLTRK